MPGAGNPSAVPQDLFDAIPQLRGADLLFGNSIDPRWLSEFGGELRVTTAPDMNPYYAFDGFLDELRISTTARQDFGYARNVGSK